MGVYLVRKAWFAAALAVGLCVVAFAHAADRKRDTSAYQTDDSFFSFFNRDRARKPSDRENYWGWKRTYSYDDDYWSRRQKRAKRQRRAGSVKVVERPEPPLVYVPERFEMLRAVDLPEAAPEAPLAAAIYGELKSKKSPIRVTPAERKALVDFYLQNGFRAVWVSQTGLGERGRSMLRFFQAASEDGMTSEDYLPLSLARFDDDLELISGDVRRLARLDLDLSTRALRYARHASGGRLIPNRLTVYHDITPETVDLANALRAFQRVPRPTDYLASLQPEHPAYAVFKRTLAALRKLRSEPNSGKITPGQKVELGGDDPGIALVRRHLTLLGYGEETVPADQETLLDDRLSERLTTFQTDAGIEPTGMLDAATILALNSRTGARGINRLVYNMERLRWLPKALGQRHVFVNQAAYSLKLVEDGRDVWRTKVIVGKSNSQTVAFSDKMETIVFNPSWGVPPSIMKNEMIPRLRRDPGYLDRLGYRVLTPNGKKIVRSRSVSWWRYSNGKVPYLILQPPGDDNALGEVKFLFPNSHSIYMHDTPTRDLFQKPTRALSHGCVRVENPRQFAELLLGVGAFDIAARIDSGVSQETPITRETAVHLTYFTAWPADDGRILFYDDVYGRDERMARAFSTVAVASR
jgi:murein L,D-transpeptidase YcbB/YkuD